MSRATGDRTWLSMSLLAPIDWRVVMQRTLDGAL
jgi:hypothetical protein